MHLRKKSITFHFIALIFISGLTGFSQVDQQAMEKSIFLKGLEHPYLLFDEPGKQELLDAIEKSPVLTEIYDRQILEAFRSLKMPVDDDIPGEGDLSRYFSNNEMRRFMARHYDAALNLAFVYQLTGKEEYAQKAFLHAEILCRLESWVYPFHEFSLFHGHAL